MNQVILPLNLEVKIPEDDIVRAVNGLVESIPEEVIYQLEQKTGRPAYHPKMILKVILYAYNQGVFSGRRIERMMAVSIRMMWLAHHKVVSYRTINRFRVNEHTANLIQEYFIQFRSQLIQSNLIDNQAIFIDGTKIEAEANKFSFVWRKSIERYNQNLKEASQPFHEELYQKQILPSLQDETSEEGLTLEQLEQAEEHLSKDVSILTETIENTRDKKVASQLLPNPTDTRTLPDFLTTYQNWHQTLSEHIVADAGY